ncbi:MAG: 50S ribosomal protein L34e [Candidatus Micrarchaeota archaeon]
MPLPKNRSNSMVKRERKTPGGRISTIYSRRKKKPLVRCGICKRVLTGVSNKRGASKTERKPSRLFGGMLCHRCVSRIIQQRARIENGEITKEEIEVRFKRYV